MALEQRFTDITIADLHPLSEQRKASGWRYVQTFCKNTEEGIDYVVTFAKDSILDNFTIKGLTKEDVLPSITDLFFSAFVFENEAHDLFGVKIKDIVIDFDGHFYDLACAEPMTVISPAQKAARDKAKKAAAAKAAKAAKEAKAKAEASGEQAPAKTPEQEEAELEAKLAGMDPDKAAKVRAAYEAKKKREAAKAAAGKGE